MLGKMSTETQEFVGTKPLPEHAWLKKLVGEWKVESEMTMPDGTTVRAEGREVASMLGDLWVLSEGEGDMPDGGKMRYRTGLGYDVSFKEYRGFWLADVSSHLWRYHCQLSEDGRTMTMNCEGPHMEKDGETANYRDVIELLNEDERTLTSFGQDESGAWHPFMRSRLTRI
jgi:hypothetical protein